MSIRRLHEWSSIFMMWMEIIWCSWTHNYSTVYKCCIPGGSHWYIFFLLSSFFFLLSSFFFLLSSFFFLLSSFFFLLSSFFLPLFLCFFLSFWLSSFLFPILFFFHCLILLKEQLYLLQAERIAKEYHEQAQALHKELQNDPSTTDISSITDFDSFARTLKGFQNGKKVSQETLQRRKERYV